MKTIAIIVAGGSGTRFGAQLPKQFLELGGKPILMRTIEAFGENKDGSFDVIVTLPADQMDLWRTMCERYGFAVPHRVVAGGETRWHSVKNALDSIGDIADGSVDVGGSPEAGESGQLGTGMNLLTFRNFIPPALANRDPFSDPYAPVKIAEGINQFLNDNYIASVTELTGTVIPW